MGPHFIFVKLSRLLESSGIASIRFDVEGLLLGTGFVDNTIELDIYKKSQVYDKKSLIIHGDRDDIVPLSASEKYINIFGDKSKLKIINEANHTFNLYTLSLLAVDGDTL